MATDLTGRRALVTGGADDIGRAIARLLIERGASVMLADLDEAEVRAVAHELGDRARAVHCDVMVAADVEHAVLHTVAELGGLELLVNNFCLETVAPLFEQTETDFDRLMNGNARSVFLAMKYAVVPLAKSGRGVIVNMASRIGPHGTGRRGLYGTSKAAVLQLTRDAAAELAELGIRVNAVSPGHDDSALVGRLGPLVRAATGQELTSLQALKELRRGSVDEVAEMVAYLASDDAAFAPNALDGDAVRGGPVREPS